MESKNRLTVTYTMELTDFHVSILGGVWRAQGYTQFGADPHRFYTKFFEADTPRKAFDGLLNIIEMTNELPGTVQKAASEAAARKD